MNAGVGSGGQEPSPDSSGGSGTGFLIGKNRFLTNAHVVSNARVLYIKKVGDPATGIPAHGPEWTDHNDSDPGVRSKKLYVGRLSWFAGDPAGNEDGEYWFESLLPCFGSRGGVSGGGQDGIIGGGGARWARSGLPRAIFQIAPARAVILPATEALTSAPCRQAL